MSVTIDGSADFPALYRSADLESERAQRSYLRSFRVRLGALLVAAFGGALTLITAGGFQVGGGLAFLGFACALGAELFLATTSPLTTWYEGWAAAESAKTLAWRYMVRAEPFAADALDVDKQFLAQTYSLLQDLRSISLGTGESVAHQISDKMRQVRALDFNERRQVVCVNPPKLSASRAAAISSALTVAVARTAQLARITHRLNVRSVTRASVSASAYCRASSTGALLVSRALSLGAEVFSCTACSTGDRE
jgi:hypothetical protein